MGFISEVGTLQRTPVVMSVGFVYGALGPGLLTIAKFFPSSLLEIETMKLLLFAIAVGLPGVVWLTLPASYFFRQGHEKRTPRVNFLAACLTACLFAGTIAYLVTFAAFAWGWSLMVFVAVEILAYILAASAFVASGMHLDATRPSADG